MESSIDFKHLADQINQAPLQADKRKFFSASLFLAFVCVFFFASQAYAQHPENASAKPKLTEPLLLIDDYAANASRATPTIKTAEKDDTQEDPSATPGVIPYQNAPMRIGPNAETWKDLSARTHRNAKNIEETSGAEIARPIRLTALPSRTLAPIPGKAATRSNRTDLPVIKAAPVEKPSKESPKTEVAKADTPENKAACDAIEEMKKRQLAAIASDNATLANLQAAIKDLGLTQKLNFAPGNQLSTSTAAADTKTASSKN